MVERLSPLPASARVSPAGARHARAWLLLVAAFAAHVADEALTGFLEFYNPLVLRIRSELPWFPMPIFTFPVWLAGLSVLLVLLLALTPAVRRGAAGMRAASYAFSAIMLLNGLGHLAGSASFGRWLPGATSAPLLIIASLLLVSATSRREP